VKPNNVGSDDWSGYSILPSHRTYLPGNEHLENLTQNFQCYQNAVRDKQKRESVLLYGDTSHKSQSEKRSFLHMPKNERVVSEKSC
jgi:hypothetical protein